ncbi:MAG: bifunctional diaminohydroxyphosphoribosylaminopyrimidine deaminase/5-amino-6-(5-phosphoribosylamino)uracil reductase RibD [Deltaproteobacteria bacterium]|nr:bifunctional diaminohydroxyphosphoribosylaminopyrimidine deaminase/5-amino-6-(5-phosphoribosylamino)uracil reductase RibD [Deltaproteobacteria bacterium]
MKPAKDDAAYMRLALNLARKSRPNPNPRVGSVIVKNNRVIGQGYHHSPGMPHAEIEALNDARQSGEDVEGATIYVTLEPCCHYGRTGPCCVAVHESGIRRVVVGMQDPDTLVAGKGIESLRQNGHDVEVGVLETECRQLLDTYIQHRHLGRPLFHLKAAISMDGYVATKSGDSKWITGPLSRTKAHELRASHDAILVGIGTVLADNPTLNVRHLQGDNPTRVVLDSWLRIPDTCNLLQTPNESNVVLIHGPKAPEHRISTLSQRKNIQLIECPTVNAVLDLKGVSTIMNSLGFLSVLVEGGSLVHGSFIHHRYADRLSLFIAPKIIGEGIPWATLPGVDTVSNSVTLSYKSIRTTSLECDTLIEGTFEYPNTK